jgi:hypothetical protein
MYQITILLSITIIATEFDANPLFGISVRTSRLSWDSKQKLVSCISDDITYIVK